ncbi:hypothetical protein Q9R32_16460 [Actinotalea sp. AC32]|nr:hypothetical protein [Actinotalea sp. AC32]
MLFLQGLTHDPSTRTLRVRMVNPSRTRWALFEYRDVPEELYDRLRTAGPDRTGVLGRLGAEHDVRRVGEPGWHRAGTVDVRLGG